MKQILQSYRDGELWVAEVPAPRPGAGQVLVRTHASVISPGTERMLVALARKSLVGKAIARPDLVRKVLAKIKAEGLTAAMDTVSTRLDEPVAMGYSCAGTVVESGEGPVAFRVGDRVACGGAGYASHAEMNAVPRNLCCRIPDGVTDEQAAFATIGAIALQGVRQAGVGVGDRVAVIGLGMIGQLTVQILKASGCPVVGIDPRTERRELAAGFCTGVFADADAARGAIQAMTQGFGVDAAIVCASAGNAGPLEAAADLVRQRGRMVVVGMVKMELPRDICYRKELDLRMSMSYGPGRYDAEFEERGHDYPYAYVRWTEQRNMEAFLELVQAGAVGVDALLTERRPIGEALELYRRIEADAGCLGALIEYPAGDAASSHIATTAAPAAIEGVLMMGMIGAGKFCQSVLLPALCEVPDIDVDCICTQGGVTSEQVAKRFGIPNAVRDPESVIENERVRAVIVTTRHDSHAELAIRALQAGKHIFVEKPLAISPESLDRLVEAWSALGPDRPMLQVGYNRRFSPHAAAVAQVLAQRRTPAVLAVRVNAGRVPADSWIQDPAVGGGRIVGELCHFVDLCRFLVASPVVRVFAEGISTHDPRVPVEDNIAVSMAFADGSLASIVYTSEGSRAVPKERAEIHWDGHSAVIDNFRVTRFMGDWADVVGTRQQKGFREELEAFCLAARGIAVPPIPFSEIIEVSRVTFAVRESLRSGEPVEL